MSRPIPDFEIRPMHFGAFSLAVLAACVALLVIAASCPGTAAPTADSARGVVIR